MNDSNTNEIKTLVNSYFLGVFNGDITKLQSVFHADSLLFGDIKGDPYFKTLKEYLTGVQNRKSPNDLGEECKMEILTIEIEGNTAIVKAHVPMLGFNYYDFLSLCKLNGNWKIVNKLFTHVE